MKSTAFALQTLHLEPSSLTSTGIGRSEESDNMEWNSTFHSLLAPNSSAYSTRVSAEHYAAKGALTISKNPAAGIIGSCLMI